MRFHRTNGTILNLNMSGKRALITGANSGLGAHFARVLAGAHVILAARRFSALEEVASTIHKDGGSCETAQLDVQDQASILSLAPLLSGLDVLVNNAGLVRDAAAIEQSAADWDAVIDTNLKGTFLLTQTAAKAMIAERRGGSIINIASILGVRQAGKVLPYAVSKAGVIQLTKTLALECSTRWQHVWRHVIPLTEVRTGFSDRPLREGGHEG